MSAIIDKYAPYGYRIMHGGHAPRQQPLSAGDVVIAVDDRRLPFGKRIYFKVAKTVVINGENVYYLTDRSVLSHEQYEHLYMDYDHVFVTGDVVDGMIPIQSSHYMYRALMNPFDRAAKLKKTCSQIPNAPVIP